MAPGDASPSDTLEPGRGAVLFIMGCLRVTLCLVEGRALLPVRDGSSQWTGGPCQDILWSQQSRTYSHSPAWTRSRHEAAGWPGTPTPNRSLPEGNPGAGAPSGGPHAGPGPARDQGWVPGSRPHQKRAPTLVDFGTLGFIPRAEARRLPWTAGLLSSLQLPSSCC